MSDSLSALANRANFAYSNRPGFVRCFIESEQPPILTFDFTSAEAAQQFMFEMDLQGARTEIRADRPETVLQHR